MATGTIVGQPWQDSQATYVAVQVAEGGKLGNVEYIGSVSLTDDLAAVGFAGQTWSQLTNAQKKTALQNAVKAQRDAMLASKASVAGISGSVTL